MEVCAFPGAASLLEQIDKPIMVWLRDGRTFRGHLRSVDQFANLVLYKVVERIHVGNMYADLPHGILLVRGENVALLGEVGEEDKKEEDKKDKDKEDTRPKVADLKVVLKAEAARRERLKVMEGLRQEVFKRRNIVYSQSFLDLF